LIIYKATNINNNKCYIGQTIKPLNERKQKHIQRANYGTDFYFYRAIRKHNPNSFQWEILEECSSKEELDEMEFHYIKQYNSFQPNGYNLTMGGEGSHGYKHTEKSKKKIGKKSKGKNNGMYGRKRSQRVKDAISKANKGRKLTEEQLKKWSEVKIGTTHTEVTKKKISKMQTGINNTFYGRKHSEVTKKKISDKIKGENHPNSKLDNEKVLKIKELLNDDISIKKISILFNVSRSTIERIKYGKSWIHVKPAGED
jgi:group I intron endonuclease